MQIIIVIRLSRLIVPHTVMLITFIIGVFLALNISGRQDTIHGFLLAWNLRA